MGLDFQVHRQPGPAGYGSPTTFVSSAHSPSSDALHGEVVVLSDNTALLHNYVRNSIKLYFSGLIQGPKCSQPYSNITGTYEYVYGKL